MVTTLQAVALATNIVMDITPQALVALNIIHPHPLTNIAAAAPNIEMEVVYFSTVYFLSPPVQIARWTHMHRFPSVCPSDRLSVCL